MSFTALHRCLGIPPGPLTNEMIDAAIADGVAETDDLDWKSELPPAKGLSDTDFPKDIAAMANSGGGILVYGVKDRQKVATSREDTGDLVEVHERALRSAAITAITPPVFGLEIHQLGTATRAVAVIVPASVDGPHLIYRGEYFGAPIRNNADTVWMKERQVEALYRARFDEQRKSNAAMDSLYAEAAAGRDTANRAWLIAVAHPRIPGTLVRPPREEARKIFKKAEALRLNFSNGRVVSPLRNVNSIDLRPGLRRWVAPNNATDAGARWREAWASVHHDGSVTVVAAVGGHRSGSDSNFEGWEVESQAIEAAIADFAALLRAAADTLNHAEYDVTIGVEWTGEEPLSVLTVDGLGCTYRGVTTPLSTCTRVRSTINAAAPLKEFHQQVYDIAQDCVNQGGITNLHVITVPESGES